MIFLDLWFWAFAAVAVPGYWICPRRAKLVWLVAASAVFHTRFAGPAGVLPILGLAILTYAAGLAIEARGSRRTLAAAAFLLVGSLAFYKYSEFLLEAGTGALALLAGLEPPAWIASWSAPAAPLAISFFTFEFVHYLYEVGVRGRTAIRNPLHFGAFAIFFPTLASGPIKRFPDFVPQLERLSTPGIRQVAEGGKRVIRGLFKKVCIADVLAEYITVLEGASQWNAPLVGTLAILQGLRIYYDFAGYSDMAIGLAGMLGLSVPENFDRPYFSTSLRDFWRRWHMSLSSWIRDYVYIPLGGNRSRRALNLLLAMAICGLWHGAAWNFAAWGIFHGLGLALETGVQRLWPTLFTAGGAVAAARLAVCYTYVQLGWLLFFYPLHTVADMTWESLRWCAALW